MLFAESGVHEKLVACVTGPRCLDAATHNQRRRRWQPVPRKAKLIQHTRTHTPTHTHAQRPLQITKNEMDVRSLTPMAPAQQRRKGTQAARGFSCHQAGRAQACKPKLAIGIQVPPRKPITAGRPRMAGSHYNAAVASPQCNNRINHAQHRGEQTK